MLSLELVQGTPIGPRTSVWASPREFRPPGFEQSLGEAYRGQGRPVVLDRPLLPFHR
jgi:hypothetical protein